MTRRPTIKPKTFHRTLNGSSLRYHYSCHPRPAPSLLLSLTKHVDEEKLGDIPVAELDVFFFERRPDACTLLGHDPSLLGRGLARPHGPNQLAQLDGHGSKGSISSAFQARSALCWFCNGRGGVRIYEGRPFVGSGRSSWTAVELLPVRF